MVLVQWSTGLAVINAQLGERLGVIVGCSSPSHLIYMEASRLPGGAIPSIDLSRSDKIVSSVQGYCSRIYSDFESPHDHKY